MFPWWFLIVFVARHSDGGQDMPGKSVSSFSLCLNKQGKLGARQGLWDCHPRIAPHDAGGVTSRAMELLESWAA